MSMPSKTRRRPTSVSPIPTTYLIVSNAIIEPMIPGSTPNTPASAQLGTAPGGRGVVGQVAGREVVGPVDDDVVVLEHVERILGVEVRPVLDDLDVGIHRLQR